MIPIRTEGSEHDCRPEWIRLNPLLSWCTRQQAAPSGAAAEDATSTAPRCTRQDCLFSAARR
ncbi:hypothetical protein [Noviherbaspirillum denitrificans]|uniref:hypothetical protein n=1 Tax=Noviherbaspirillum denitrificans TaxID=1968433 RepID=UPI0011308E54|nr:hypothetical protein [Noviherbaspirillum denitrificans]